MPEKTKFLLILARYLLLGTTAVVILLAGESIITKEDMFLSYALGVGVVGLAFLTLIIWTITRSGR